MKKIFSFLLLGLLLSIGNAWAAVTSYTITFKEGTGTSSDSGTKVTSISDIISDGASYVASIPTATNVYNGRVGRGIKLGTSSKTGELKLTLASAVTPTKITFRARKYNDSETGIKVNDLEVTNLTGDFDEYTKTYDGATSVSQIVISTTSSSKRAYITQVTVYYESGAAPVPSITANDVNITYNATAGSVAYSVDNAVQGGVVTASTTSDWLNLGTVTANSVPLTFSANSAAASRSAVVVLTYTYNTNETVTKNVTVTQAADPNALINISTITGSGMGFNIKGTIVAISARGFVIGDGTGYAYYYGGSSFTTTHVIGDVVRISGTTNSYNKVIQLPDASTISDATNSGYDNTPAIQVLDHEGIEAYSAGPYLSDYVQVEGKLVKSGDYYNLQVTDLATDASISYPTADQKTALNSLLNKQVIVKGYFGGVSSSHFNIILESIEEKVIIIPAINLSATSINATAAEKTGTIDVTYDNITDIDAEVHFFESDGTTPATYNWIEAEINNENNLYYVIGANTGAARTAYMKVYTLDDSGDDVYSALITVSQERYISDYVTLPLSYNGGKDNLPDGFTATGLGSDYNPSTAPTTQLKFDGSGDNIIIRMNEPAGVLSFDIKGNSFSSSLFRVQTSADGVQYSDLKVYQDLGETQTERFAIAANVRYIKWIYENKSTGNVGLGNIKLDKPVTLGANGYSTYAADFNYTVSGADAYKAKYQNGAIVLTQVNVIEAGEGIVLKGANAGDVVTITPSNATADDFLDNELVGVLAPTQAEATWYVLATNLDGDGLTKFHQCENVTIPANKAFIEIVENPSNAPIRIIEAGNEATDIQNVEGAEKAVKFMENGKLYILKNGVVYDAMGKTVR